MKLKTRIRLLGIYDLLLAVGAIYTGLLMVRSRGGIFLVYPKEWLNKLPFHSWIIPGLIAMFLFGGGNMLASFASFLYESGKSWIISIIMGMLLFLSIIAQVIILDEWYMLTVQVLVLSLFQVAFSLSVFSKLRKIS